MKRFVAVLVLSACAGLLLPTAFAAAPVVTVFFTVLWVLAIVQFARHFRW